MPTIWLNCSNKSSKNGSQCLIYNSKGSNNVKLGSLEEEETLNSKKKSKLKIKTKAKVKTKKLTYLNNTRSPS